MPAFEDFDDTGLGETADERRAFDREMKEQILKAIAAGRTSSNATIPQWQDAGVEIDPPTAGREATRSTATNRSPRKSPTLYPSATEVIIAFDSDSIESLPAAAPTHPAPQRRGLIEWKAMDKVAKEYELWRKSVGLATVPAPTMAGSTTTKKGKARASAASGSGIVIKSRLMEGLKVCAVMSANAIAALKNRWKIVSRIHPKAS